MTSKHGSLEVYFTYAHSTTRNIRLDTNIMGVRQFSVGEVDLENVSIMVASTKDGSNPVYFQVKLLLGEGTVIDQSDFTTGNPDITTFDVRLFCFDQFVSVSVNDFWVYSYSLAEVEYPDAITASLTLFGPTDTLANIRRVELADGREAIFVDYESTTDNAIQSIIQQRPILIIPHMNRKLSFTYRAERDVVPASFVISYTERTSHPSQLSSDGLVYGDDVGVSIDVLTAKEVGFITKLYRLPDLTTGAIPAAGTMQRQARERRVIVDVIQRLDPRLEISDVLDVDFFSSGTGRHVQQQVIIENISITLRDGEQSMTISGRKKT